ncbi:polyphosphate kinase 2 family protein [Actinospongicola halichondriae]|uniref:polyphosphate kinase 2 family protein n=1 Tax=Actinospongicola halichondriae TaxID=3236844 RepID=UPI003D37A20D
MNPHRIAPGTSVDLSTIDTRATPTFDGDKEASAGVFAERQHRLAELQDVLYAQGKHRLLVVLQAMDTGGKDGTIRHVFHHVDPIGVRMRSFKKPSEVELAHDYLWRVHPHVPGDGELVVFNRSHYEDVLVVRVHGWVDDDLAHKRFRHIREFEQMLTDEGTTIVKIFLHISKDEQAERLQARLDEPNKNWKFSTGDLEERKLWDDYQRVYAEAIGETSTADAPWYVVPADRKWYRNLVVSQILIDTMESLDLRYPDPEDDLEDVVIE